MKKRLSTIFILLIGITTLQADGMAIRKIYLTRFLSYSPGYALVIKIKSINHHKRTVTGIVKKIIRSSRFSGHDFSFKIGKTYTFKKKAKPKFIRRKWIIVWRYWQQLKLSQLHVGMTIIAVDKYGKQYEFIPAGRYYKYKVQLMINRDWSKKADSILTRKKLLKRANDPDFFIQLYTVLKEKKLLTHTMAMEAARRAQDSKPIRFHFKKLNKTGKQAS